MRVKFGLGMIAIGALIVIVSGIQITVSTMAVRKEYIDNATGLVAWIHNVAIILIVPMCLFTPVWVQNSSTRYFTFARANMLSNVISYSRWNIERNNRWARGHIAVIAAGLAFAMALSPLTAVGMVMLAFSGLFCYREEKEGRKVKSLAS